MVNWVPIVAATVAAVPAAAVFFITYGRYDGAFRDNIVFLYFMGGLLAGGFLGVLTLAVYGIVGVPALIAQVVGLALLYPITMVLIVNRRKWQGERHAIFNGGAAGLGVSVMLGFSLVYVTMQRHAARLQQAAGAPIDSKVVAFDPQLATQGLVLGASLALLFFALGLLAGDGARRRAQFRVALLGTAIIIPPVVFLGGWVRGVGAWLYLALLLAYGAAFAVAAERRIFLEAVPPDARRKRRRQVRSGAP